MINFVFEKISTALPPNFFTIAISVNKALYSALLLVAKKLNLKYFSIVILSGDISAIPTPDPL